MDYFIFAADCYCGDCGRAIKQRITAEGNAPAEPDNERTYDSGDFPKGPYDGKSDESDSPQHCASGEHCLNAMQIGSGRKSGVWLENPLTSAGVHYVIEAVREGGDVAEFWSDCYREELQAEGVFLCALHQL